MESQRSFFMILFVASVFMVWLNWNTYQHKKNQPAISTATNQTNASAKAADGVKIPDYNPVVGATGANGAVGGAVANTGVGANTVSKVAADLVEVDTDLYRLWLSSVGANIVKVELKKYPAQDDKGPLILMNADGKYQYSARSGLLDSTGAMPNHLADYSFDKKSYQLSDGEKTLTITAQAKASNGAVVQKVITLSRGSYQVQVDFVVKNTTDSEISLSPYYLLTHNSETPEGSNFAYSTFTGPAYYSPSRKYNKINWSDIKDSEAKHRFTDTDGWMSMVQHYFVSAWILPKGETRQFFVHGENQPNLYSAGINGANINVPAGQMGKVGAIIYMGPQNQGELSKLAEGLDLVVDYGILAIIAQPLFVLMQWIHSVVGNWGWTIVLLTVLIKAVFFPLSAASYKSMAKMRKLTPKMTQLREMYANDKQKQQQELIRLYQTEKVNPLGGCLPIIIQIPVFLALYWVLLGSVEMRNAPWMAWIADLAKPDPFYVLPVLMAVTMFVQTKLNPPPPDPMQAKIMNAMPIVFSVMFFFFPSGLVLYWVVNNTLSIAQQYYNNKAYGEPTQKR